MLLALQVFIPELGSHFLLPLGEFQCAAAISLREHTHTYTRINAHARVSTPTPTPPQVFIPELGATFRCHPRFRLFAAQNPLQEGGGRKGLPRSFLNRFTR